jgi:hypothetical protein
MARAVPWRFRWAAVAYLVLVVGVTVFVYVAASSHQDDASFAGVWLIIVTLPVSMVLGLTGPAPFEVLVALGVAQAGLVFLLCWWLDRRWAR